ncbi:hypothetical protein KNSL1_009281 [Colletotrichum chrysophilum]|nr:hypothetical protein KNSL1_009281 [Colletotrichum chrysophilum]
MTSQGRIDVIVGTSNFGYPDNFWGNSESHIIQAFQLMKKHGSKKLDTAKAYFGSEAKLGAMKAGTDFDLDLDTKWLGGYDRADDANTRSYMLSSARKSIETLAVQRLYDVAKNNGFVLPTVYQGNYSAVARKPEADLFPVLRKLGISFVAYSPIAGGFLTKTREQIESGGTRFSPDQMFGIYHKLYVKDSYLSALEEWGKIAEEEQISKAELAYRWVVYHSILRKQYGDGIVFGSSSLSQMEETLLACNRGPLSEKAVEAIEQIWEKVKDEAGVDNYQTVFSGN